MVRSLVVYCPVTDALPLFLFRFRILGSAFIRTADLFLYAWDAPMVKLIDASRSSVVGSREKQPNQKEQSARRKLKLMCSVGRGFAVMSLPDCSRSSKDLRSSTSVP